MYLRKNENGWKFEMDELDWFLVFVLIIAVTGIEKI
jgi:hypothetical protein